jgi:hypothetical protein
MTNSGGSSPSKAAPMSDALILPRAAALCRVDEDTRRRDPEARREAW